MGHLWTYLLLKQYWTGMDVSLWSELDLCSLWESLQKNGLWVFTYFRLSSIGGAWSLVRSLDTQGRQGKSVLAFPPSTCLRCNSQLITSPPSHACTCHSHWGEGEQLCTLSIIMQYRMQCCSPSPQLLWQAPAQGKITIILPPSQTNS